MKQLSIDIETYSSVDLISSGLYKYVESEDFQVLLFAYAADDEPVTVLDLAQGEHLPLWIERALFDSSITKCAWNATFERVCLSRHLGKTLPINQWQDTMVMAQFLGLPMALGKAAEAIGLDEQKDKSGRALINFFSKPCTPTARNNQRTRNLPHHDPDKWDLYKRYNAQDVLTERAIKQHLEPQVEITPFEKRLYEVDQHINDRGVALDMDLVNAIVSYHEQYLDRILTQSKLITKLDNPQSLAQLKGWLVEQGIATDTLRKGDVIELLQDADIQPHVRQVLINRQELGKTSTKKYDAMQAAVCNDGRARGLLQYYGANKTGRWAGRLIQVQNLPRNYLPEISDIRELIKNGNAGALEGIYDSVSDIFSQLLRTSFIPSPGHTFCVFDYSAIEARVIAWLAQEEWLQEVFAGDGKVYEATASKMFNTPMDKIDKPLRQRGKVATLALGYQGGVGALKAMGALNMGIPESELQGLVNVWRKSNPNIVNLWKSVEDKAKETTHYGTTQTLYERPGAPSVLFKKEYNHLYITLPSGRDLCYYNAQIKYTDKGLKLTFEGVNQTIKRWETMDTYGGSLVENLVQAIARDCLAVSIVRLHDAGYPICFHVHDEIVVEIPKESVAEHFEKIGEIMSRPIEWAPGLGLPAEGFTSDFYTKD